MLDDFTVLAQHDMSIAQIDILCGREGGAGSRGRKILRA